MGAVYPIMFSLIFKAGRKQVFAIYAILILLSVAFFSNNNVRNRALIESDVIANIATLEWENIPMSSVGIRFNSWVESSKWIRENPIIGTSKESIHLVIKHSEKFQQSKAKDVGHLHNYYLETLVAFGIIGLVFIFVYYAYIFIVIKNKGSKEEFLLLSSFLVFWLVINNFESFNSKYYGLYIQNIVLAGIFVMNRKDKKVAEGIDDVD
jgi:O-antigen ligase